MQKITQVENISKLNGLQLELQFLKTRVHIPIQFFTKFNQAPIAGQLCPVNLNSDLIIHFLR